jgi:hypothetical protein
MDWIFRNSALAFFMGKPLSWSDKSKSGIILSKHFTKNNIYQQLITNNQQLFEN